MRKGDPKFVAFVVGFSIVTIVGAAILGGWMLFGAAPFPTLVPSTIPPAEQVAVQPAEGIPTVVTLPVQTFTPTPSPVAVTASPTPAPIPSQAVEYTVQQGDTLFDIALAYGVTIEAIQAANNLQGEIILPDQVLLIPVGPAPTPTPLLEGQVVVHTVSSGDTLIGIAEHYGVTVEAIQTANELDSETIRPGLQLRIPGAGGAPALPAPSPSAVAADWHPSILIGDLEQAYPLTLEGNRFVMHYQPASPAARGPDRLYALIESALEHIETKLQVDLQDSFDVYIAGTLFAGEDIALRGRSFSSERRNFYLNDDTGTPDERRYLITHELTHLVAWNTLGRPASVMLHEGLAVYAGAESLQAGGFIPLSHVCAAYYQEGRLPRLSANRTYLGHIRDLDLYYSAGCFVEYLVKTYGLQDLKRAYASADYPGIYGRTLAQLEAEWTATLKGTAQKLTFDASDLVAVVPELADAYDLLFLNFRGTPSELAAYRELDQARIAVLQARFEEAREHLAEFEQLLSSKQ